MIIGVNGFKGSGKDTIGQFLVNNYEFKRASFAAKLKQSAASLWEINPALWERFKNNEQMRVMLYLADEDEPWAVKSDGDPNYFVSTISVRTFLQRYGTEAHRDIFGTDFWVKEALKDIDPAGNYVFTDARFTNELEAIRNLGGWNIRVIRNGTNNEDTHASEVVPPNELIDFVVFNNGDFDFLHREVEFVLDRIEEEIHGIQYTR